MLYGACACCRGPGWNAKSELNHEMPAYYASAHVYACLCSLRVCMSALQVGIHIWVVARKGIHLGGD